VLNVNRDSMAETGFSPPTRIFEAAGAGACVVTDAWAGIEQFFAPHREIFLAASAEEVVEHLRQTSPEQARAIGEAMRERALRDHTYEQRAAAVEAVLHAREAAEVAG
jgi:spore maturation protein CgeB